MYQKKNIRVYIAWMLFMTFIPFFVVKTFHYHGSEDEKSCSHAKHSHQSSDDCAICQYSLSFFTEPQPIEFHCTLTLVPYEPIIYQDKVVCKRTYSIIYADLRSYDYILIFSMEIDWLSIYPHIHFTH